MTHSEMDRFELLDNAVAELTNGEYVLQTTDEPEFSIGALLEYCRTIKKKCSELTTDELKQFELSS